MTFLAAFNFSRVGRAIAILVLIAFVALLAACNGGGAAATVTPTTGGTTVTPSDLPATPSPSATPTATDDSQAASTPTPTVPGRPGPTPTLTVTATATATATPVPTPAAPLPKREVAFTVHAPDNTPAGDTVYLLVKPFVDWHWEAEDHIGLAPQGDGLWTGTASVPEGAVVHYVYDRWNEQEWGQFKRTREGFGASVEIESRLLLVTPDLDLVEDTIETWNDLRASALTGTITGLVTDAATGAPLMDTNIAVGGIHTATDYDGRFKVEGIAAGSQRLTFYRTLGDYQPTAAMVQVPASDEAQVDVAMDAAARVAVTFDVALPEDTPPEAQVHLLGGVYQAGARAISHNNYPFMLSGRYPRLERVTPDRAVVTLELYEGTYLPYYYSIGGESRGREFNGQGRVVFRGMVVGASPQEVRHDRVTTWWVEFWPRITFRLTVPPNTPPGVPINSNQGMVQTGPFEWASWMHNIPNDTLSYSYMLGNDALDADATPGLAGADRTVAIDDEDIVVEDLVTRWAGLPAATRPPDGTLVPVTFRVSVPSTTPRDAVVRWVGGDEVAMTVAMTPQQGNPWLYEATVDLPVGQTAGYNLELATDPPAFGSVRALAVEHDAHVVDDWVTVWSNEPLTGPMTGAGTRPDFVTGIYTPDYWSPHFLPLSDTTFQRIGEHNAEWVVVSSVWSYGQTYPVPVVEPRPVNAGSVFTPKEEIVAQAAIARQHDLRVILGPQFNMEMSPEGPEPVCGAHSQAWWDAWLGEADRLWMWNAIVAEEIDAEAMVLPGPCFHVFIGVGDGPGDPYFTEFDQRVAALVAKVRGVYDGKLIISGGIRDFEFPGLADFVGVTAYGTGHPDLPYDATVDEWRDAYDARFTQAVDPLYERWGKPVMFYQFHLPRHVDDPDPTGQEFQARRLEGALQALEQRPWLAGFLSWSYAMVDAPLANEDGLRARLAEAVLAKYYGVFTGRD